MTNQNRPKASEVFADTKHLFTQKTTFDNAFPQIKDIKVVVKREGNSGLSEWNRVSHYGKDVGEFVDCTNPSCYNGGVGIGSLLRQAVENRETHIESGYKSCRGYEGSPKGYKRYRDCRNSFEVFIDIEYK